MGKSDPCGVTTRQPQSRAAFGGPGIWDIRTETASPGRQQIQLDVNANENHRRRSEQVKHQKPFISYQRLRSPLYKYWVATPCHYPVLAHVSPDGVEQWQVLNTLQFALILESLWRVGWNLLDLVIRRTNGRRLTWGVVEYVSRLATN